MLYKQQVNRTSTKLNKAVKIILILVIKVQQLNFGDCLFARFKMIKGFIKNKVKLGELRERKREKESLRKREIERKF